MPSEFSNLPEGCVAHVISLTTPRDACRFTTISALLRSAADSDAVWGRFLLPDHQSIIAQADAEVQTQLRGVHPKKQLFMRLAESPIIVDGGRKSFSLDKASGKKCVMIAAREMAIVWGDTPQYWEWNSLTDSRFAEVAHLRNVCWLELSGGIEASSLSPETTYTSYLVYKLSTDSNSFNHTPVETSVGMTAGVKDTKNIFLGPEEGRTRQLQIVQPRHPRYSISHWILPPEEESASSDSEMNGQYPQRRPDGWMEAELGECFVEEGGGDGGELVEVSVKEVKLGYWKRGLIVQGIEFRPKAPNA